MNSALGADILAEHQHLGIGFEFLVEHPVVYPMALIDVYDPPADFDTPRGLPFTYLIGPDGAVVKKYTGPVSARMLEEDIAAAGGPAVG